MKTLLIVDDDPDILESLAAVFESTYRVVAAMNGREALDIVHTGQVDVVLLDLMMPVMDGATFMQRLHGGGLSTPVILVSADPRVRDIARELGAVGYLQKPVELEPLEHAVVSVLHPASTARRA